MHQGDMRVAVVTDGISDRRVEIAGVADRSTELASELA